MKERSIAKAALAVDYLSEDMTRLMPAAAFEEAGADLIALATSTANPRRSKGLLAAMLAEDLDALLFVRFPQFPSSRAFGDAPAVTPWEFHSRVPSEPGRAQIIPVPPRPFPAALRDPDLIADRRPMSAYVAAIWGGLLLVGIPLFLYRWWRRRQRRESSNPQAS